MKKLIYINIGTPELKKAHALQTLFTCKNLSRYFTITLIYPLTLSLIRKRQHLRKEYKKHGIDLVLLPTTSLGRLHSFLFLIDKLIFSFLAFFYSVSKSSDTIFTRDHTQAYILCFLKSFHNKRIVFEIHLLEHMLSQGISKKIMRYMEHFSIKRSDAILTVIKWIVPYARKFNTNAFYVPNAFEPSVFRAGRRKEARKKLGLSPTKPLIVYSGLTFRAGIETLVRAGDVLQKSDIVIVGGDRKSIQSLKKNATKNVLFVGRVSPERVALYLNAADVLVLPYSKTLFTEYLTCPIKLFEYMAMKKPIVATAIRSIQDIVNSDNAVLVGPDDPHQLAKGIQNVLRHKTFAKRIADRAFHDSKKYTYQKRAEKIKNIIEELSE